MGKLPARYDYQHLISKGKKIARKKTTLDNSFEIAEDKLSDISDQLLDLSQLIQRIDNRFPTIMQEQLPPLIELIDIMEEKVPEIIETRFIELIKNV